MMSIQELFKETSSDVEEIPRKYLKRMSRNCKHVKGTNIIPELSYPVPGTAAFKKDLDNLKHHFHNPTLNSDFLVSSDESIEGVFKTYCDQNDLNPNWDYIDKLIKDADSVILTLKYKYNRPRPKNVLKNEDDHDAYSAIKDCKSPSFPSGHTALAHFIGDILTSIYPQDSADFKTIAELIGQSRIENGVHYPSDVLYGKFIGELLADLYLSSADRKENSLEKTRSRKDDKKFSAFLRRKAISDYPLEKSSDCYKEMLTDIANFICRTNEIERIKVPFSDAFKSAKMLLEGYPVEKISDNVNISSMLKGMSEAYRQGKIDNPYKIFSIHNQFHPTILDRGTPRSMRTFRHMSPTGTTYCEPENIFHSLRKTCQIDDPFYKHVVYEWVHPFCDGNGRSGRIVMLSDNNFDFAKTNEMINEKYINNLVNLMDEDEIRKMLA